MANKLEEGFTKADSRNLPKIEFYMIYNFISQDDRFNAPEVRGAKANTASRESYGDAAIGYVCVKREGSICTLKAKICPEHKVREKIYAVVLTINEEEKIIKNVECLNCAAAQGGCKHAFAFLMWTHRRSEEPASTDVTCYWKKSVLSGVGTNKKFILAAEMAKESNNEDNLPNNENFLHDVISKLNENQLDVQLSRYTTDILSRSVYNLSIHNIILLFSSQNSNSAEDFIIFAKNRLNDSLCKDAEQKTRQQSDNLLWHELRYGRITASKIYEASRCKTVNGSLVKQILGTSKVFDSISMKRGRLLEAKVFEELEKKGYEIEKSGFILVPAHPVLGASPDGVSKEFIVEIKCPNSKETFKNYLCDGKITKKCKAQMLLQMLAAGKRKGLFCVADSEFEENKKLYIEWIDYNQDEIEVLIDEATRFWKQNIFPVLNQINF